MGHFKESLGETITTLTGKQDHLEETSVHEKNAQIPD